MPVNVFSYVNIKMQTLSKTFNNKNSSRQRQVENLNFWSKEFILWFWWRFFSDSILFSYAFFPPNKIFISLFLHIPFSGALRPIMPLFCLFSLQKINLVNECFTSRITKLIKLRTEFLVMKANSLYIPCVYSTQTITSSAHFLGKIIQYNLYLFFNGIFWYLINYFCNCRNGSLDQSKSGSSNCLAVPWSYLLIFPVVAEIWI